MREKRSRLSNACNTSRRRQSAVTWSGGSAWSMTPRAPAFSKATMPTVRGCVNDFDTAKSRCGIQASQQSNQTQGDPKLMHPFQSVLPSGPAVNTRREARWRLQTDAVAKGLCLDGMIELRRRSEGSQVSP